MQLTTFAQVQNNPPMRQVLGSGGTTGVLPWGTIDFTIGEPIIWTYAPATTPLTVKVLTQGFQQPNTSSGGFLDASVIYSPSSCIGANNGSASLNILSATGPVSYFWSAPISDSSANQANLAPGVYYFYVTDGNFNIYDSVTIVETQVECADELTFYHGITPNGDNNNDFWTVEGLELVKDNVVSIFNRWGDMVWSTKDYDNNPSGDKVWKGKSKTGAELPDATYFYVIEAGGKVYKGWVELTH